MAVDQNGNKLSTKPVHVFHADGSEGWARRVWAGGVYGHAIDLRWYVYAKREAALDGSIMDTYGNSPDLIDVELKGWSEA